MAFNSYDLWELRFAALCWQETVTQVGYYGGAWCAILVLQYVMRYVVH
jgi:hypothetical protein